MKIDNLLIFVGILIFLIGVFLKVCFKFKIFPLPGDIIIKGENYFVFIPITTSIILSIILTLIFLIFFKK